MQQVRSDQWQVFTSAATGGRESQVKHAGVGGWARPPRRRRPSVPGWSAESWQRHSIIMYTGSIVPQTFQNVLKLATLERLGDDGLDWVERSPWKRDQKSEKPNGNVRVPIGSTPGNQKTRVSMVTFRGAPPPFDEPIRSQTRGQGTANQKV